MKKIKLTLFFLALTMVSFAQATYEKGYFIKTNGERIDCFIENEDWRTLPETFKFKKEDEIVQRIEKRDLQEISIGNTLKYVRKTVQMDTSAARMDLLTENKQAEYKQVEIFLRVIVEGKTALYRYIDTEQTRFFFTLQDGTIEQLIAKKYIRYGAKNDKQIVNSRQYQQQLSIALKCETIAPTEFLKVSYSTNSLKKIFQEYNACQGHETTVLLPKRDFYNLGLKASYGPQRFHYTGRGEYADIESYDFRFGIENELILPFNNNKWRILFEPTYHYQKGVDTVTLVRSNFPKHYLTLNYKSIELSVGVRYYMYLNKNSSLFVDFAAVQAVELPSSSATFTYPDILFLIGRDIDPNIGLVNGMNIKPDINLQAGVGFRYKNFSIELRHFFDKELIKTYPNERFTQRSTMVTIGYYLF